MRMSTLESAACAEVSTNAEVLASADIALQPTAAGRVRFLDAVRLFATFQMLQGHTVAALLAPAHRSGWGYELWSRARGLTSVCFLFAAGMAFYLTSARAFAAGRGAGRTSKRVRRALFLIVLGYALHAPGLASSPREWMQVDVLQCIGVTLLMLEAALLVTGTRARWLTLVAGAWAVTLFVAALPWRLPHTPLAAYFGPQFGSQFPLLPWSSHAFAGVWCGALTRGDRARAPQRLAAAAFGLLACAAVVKLATGSVLLFDHVTRCACVIGLCAALAWLSNRPEARHPWPPVLERLTSESLFIYVFHVVLVYGAQVGLATLVGPRLDPIAAMCAAALVVFASAAAALAWPALAERLPELVRWLAGATRTR
jgi:uncharacterized membrane protein